MIKLILFDLDGVLADTEDIHFHALIDAIKNNTGLSEYDIFKVVKKDGTNTLSKLQNLKKTYSDILINIEEIDAMKQELTIKGFRNIKRNEILCDTLQHLKNFYKLGIVSNSRKINVEFIVNSLEISSAFDLIVTPENGLLPKPSSSMYDYAIQYMGCDPSEVLILEDSDAGIEAALKSGSNVLIINTVEDTNLCYINRAITNATNSNNSYGGKRQQIYSSRL